MENKESDMKYEASAHITHTKYFSFKEFSVDSQSLPFRLLLMTIRYVNKAALAVAGVKLVRESKEGRLEQFCYPCDKEIIKIRILGLVRAISDFLSKLGINAKDDELQLVIIEYDRLFRDDQVSNLNGGMGYNNGMMLFCVSRFYSPKIVIESGVWRGFTTYLLDSAIPSDSLIYAFDINLSLIEFQLTKATYYEKDISTQNLDLKGYKVLAFFDDHVSHYDRLRYCIKNQIDMVVFDDDVSVTTVHSDGWPPIPTANMVINYEHIPHKFKWVSNGRIGEADISMISKSTCELIRHEYNYQIMPDLFELTGYRNSSVTSFMARR